MTVVAKTFVPLFRKLEYILLLWFFANMGKSTLRKLSSGLYFRSCKSCPALLWYSSKGLAGWIICFCIPQGLKSLHVVLVLILTI